jgi:hypothetical protein
VWAANSCTRKARGIATGRGNPNLPADKPWDWKQDASADNWPHTNQSRCELYAEGTFVSMDVEGEDGPADTSFDQEQIYAICAHSKRPPSGYGK